MNINLIAPICNTSYGIVGSYLVDSLTKLGCKVALFPINDRNQLTCHPKLIDSIQQALNNAEMPNFDAPCIRLWHQFNMSQFVGRGIRVGFPIFELDTFTKQELHHLQNGCDSIFVCSKWADGVIEESVFNGRCDISNIIPLGIDPEVFYPAKSNRKTTVFFNAGKWEVRKGHDILIDAFCQAFKPDDDVELWMLCHNQFYTEEENNRWEYKYRVNNSMEGKVRILRPQETQSQVADIMRQTDCGVFPYRAEGWNMELLEMMACGKQNIATNYSGPTEYANYNNCHMFTPTEMESAFDGKWFKNQGNWAKLDNACVDVIIHAMQTVHGRKQREGATICQEAVDTGKWFTWENTAKAVISALGE
jgi:glycosyltransferase involved in cell wall biosynthesis